MSFLFTGLVLLSNSWGTCISSNISNLFKLNYLPFTSQKIFLEEYYQLSGSENAGKSCFLGEKILK